MAREYVFTIGEHDYRGETASAKNQLEAMHICLRTTLMSILDESKTFSEMGIVGFFANVEFSDIQKLADLTVKGKITRRTDEVPVAENLFGDNTQDYYLLIYHALRENLGGFWQLQRPTSGKAVEPNS